MEGEMANPLTYPLLLDLYKGRASVVEQLSVQDRLALRIDTPLFQFIKEAAASGRPRHIFLTGNAGDGKTFAIEAADAKDFTPILDASERGDAGEHAPIDALSKRLESALAKGERLLVAINRGQLERLEAHVRSSGGSLASIMAKARAQTTLRPDWPSEDCDLVVVDLGLVDTLSDTLLDRTIDRVCEAQAGIELSPTTDEAFRAALLALKNTRVRLWVRRVLEAARAGGHHATMRELWSFLAFLATGARHPSATEPSGLDDCVGARLFSDRPDGPFFDSVRRETARRALDPATLPQPSLALSVLLGEAAALFAGLPGVLGDDKPNGRSLLRVVAVHDERQSEPPSPDDIFGRIVSLLGEQAGWQHSPTVTHRLLGGIYRCLRLPQGPQHFPAWQTLCYDSSRIAAAASVALGKLDATQLRLALPRPHPQGQLALGGTWRAPFVWLSFGRSTDDSEALTRRALRLSPRLFAALYNDDNGLLDAEVLTLRRWVASVASAQTLPAALDEISVGRRDTENRWLQLQADPLMHQTTLRWSNG